MDLTNIYTIFHPKALEYTFFLSVHETFSKIDHVLGHKSSLNKFKKIEIISGIFSDHNVRRLEITDRKKKKKTNNHKHMENKLNNQWITEKNQRGNKKLPRDK